MPRYITAKQYNQLMSVPRSKMSVRSKIFAGVIVEDKNKILLVRDAGGHFPGYDIPGGKVLWGEQIIDCAHREVLEETGYKIKLTGLLGLYQRIVTEDADDYLRFVFIGKLDKSKKLKVEDPNIIESVWLEKSDIEKNKIKLKSPETIREIHDFIKGKKFPLDVIDTYAW